MKDGLEEPAVLPMRKSLWSRSNNQGNSDSPLSSANQRFALEECFLRLSEVESDKRALNSRNLSLHLFTFTVYTRRRMVGRVTR